MAAQYVTGASPINFVSENLSGNVGKQYQIPLPLLTVTNGQPDATDWLTAQGIAGTDPDLTLVTNLIASLAAQGVLKVITRS